MNHATQLNEWANHLSTLTPPTTPAECTEAREEIRCMVMCLISDPEQCPAGIWYAVRKLSEAACQIDHCRAPGWTTGPVHAVYRSRLVDAVSQLRAVAAKWGSA